MVKNNIGEVLEVERGAIWTGTGSQSGRGPV
jgi:hypothetical protein